MAESNKYCLACNQALPFCACSQGEAGKAEFTGHSTKGGESIEEAPPTRCSPGKSPEGKVSCPCPVECHVPDCRQGTTAQSCYWRGGPEEVEETLGSSPFLSPLPPPLLYLASPYTSPDPLLTLSRYSAAVAATALLMQRGYHVFSPIVHNHPVALSGELPGTWDFWRVRDEAWLSLASHMLVLLLPGWRESTGVTAEILFARQNNISILYSTPEDLALLPSYLLPAPIYFPHSPI